MTDSALEAGALALELHQRLGSQAVRLILARPHSRVGKQHPRGMAAALDILCRVPPATEQAKAQVALLVRDGQGREHAVTVPLDAGSPYRNAKALGALELGPWLGPGRNLIRVTYQGGLAGHVGLRAHSWRAAGQTTSATSQLQAP